MSNIDKRALREAAEKALNAQARLALMESVFDDDGDDVKPEAQEDISICVSINDLTNPATMLALLDELEAKDKSISFLKDQLAQLANFNPDWDKLEAATDSLREHMAELTAARKRIAELEAREVKLPNPHAHLIWIQAGHAPDDYWDDVAVSHSEKDKCCDGSDRYPVYALWEIKDALSAIGINIAAAEKGEAS